MTVFLSADCLVACWADKKVAWMDALTVDWTADTTDDTRVGSKVGMSADLMAERMVAPKAARSVVRWAG